MEVVFLYCKGVFDVATCDFIMGRMNMETKQRVAMLWKSDMKIKNIHLHYKEEDIVVSETSLYHLVGKFVKKGKIFIAIHSKAFFDLNTMNLLME